MSLAERCNQSEVPGIVFTVHTPSWRSMRTTGAGADRGDEVGENSGPDQSFGPLPSQYNTVMQ